MCKQNIFIGKMIATTVVIITMIIIVAHGLNCSRYRQDNSQNSTRSRRLISRNGNLRGYYVTVGDEAYTMNSSSLGTLHGCRRRRLLDFFVNCYYTAINNCNDNNSEEFNVSTVVCCVERYRKYVSSFFQTLLKLYDEYILSNKNFVLFVTFLFLHTNDGRVLVKDVVSNYYFW